MTIDYERRFEQLRPRLLSFARLQLRCLDEAEDAVQDAMLTAMTKIETFDGRSQFETWVFGILKYKILDVFRSEKRRSQWLVDSIDSWQDELDKQFRDNERWQDDYRPLAWGDPESVLASSHFWRLFDACMIHLPDVPARVFSLRELMEVDIEEICSILNITENNCSVILYRARMKLRQCLEKGWLTQEGN